MKQFVKKSKFCYGNDQRLWITVISHVVADGSVCARGYTLNAENEEYAPYFSDISDFFEI